MSIGGATYRIISSRPPGVGNGFTPALYACYATYCNNCTLSCTLDCLYRAITVLYLLLLLLSILVYIGSTAAYLSYDTVVAQSATTVLQQV